MVTLLLGAISQTVCKYSRPLRTEHRKHIWTREIPKKKKTLKKQILCPFCCILGSFLWTKMTKKKKNFNVGATFTFWVQVMTIIIYKKKKKKIEERKRTFHIFHSLQNPLLVSHFIPSNLEKNQSKPPHLSPG